MTNFGSLESNLARNTMLSWDLHKFQKKSIILKNGWYVFGWRGPNEDLKLNFDYLFYSVLGWFCPQILHAFTKVYTTQWLLYLTLEEVKE